MACEWFSGRPFVKLFALCYQTVVCLSLLFDLSCTVCDVGVLWPKGWMDQDETRHAGRLWPWPHCVRWRPSSPSQRGRAPYNFWPISLPNGREVGSALVTLCQMGTQLPLPPNGHRPQFPAHVYCGQTAGWIKMPLGRELGLDPATLC